MPEDKTSLVRIFLTFKSCFWNHNTPETDSPSSLNNHLNMITVTQTLTHTQTHTHLSFPSHVPLPVMLQWRQRLEISLTPRQPISCQLNKSWTWNMAARERRRRQSERHGLTGGFSVLPEGTLTRCMAAVEPSYLWPLGRWGGDSAAKC